MRLKLTCAGQFQGENFQANLRLAARVKEIAARQRVTPSQIAMAWLLAQGDDIVPIPGTKRRHYLEENAVTIEIKLGTEDLRWPDEAIPRGAAIGQRYPDMSTVNR
jgi:aryl-alcohol dehydrogenase-like predicted oxidoreductase